MSEPNWDEAPKIVVPPPGPNAVKVVNATNESVSRVCQGISRVNSISVGKWEGGIPLVVNRGKGAVLEDVDGNLFIDFSAAITSVNAGYANPVIIKAVQEQMVKFQHFYEYPTMVRANTAKLLQEMTPGDFPKKVFFTNCGTEAVEQAIRLAEVSSGKSEILGFHDSYHGKTRASVGLTTIVPKYRKRIRKLHGNFHTPYPTCHMCPFKLEHPDCGLYCVDWIDRVIKQETTSDVAAMVAEIQAGATYVPPDDFWPAVMKKCQEHDILFIADEVQTGAGRTGKMFASEWYGIEPDITIVAKGLASGLPTGAVVARQEIMENEVMEPFYGMFTSTFGGNAVMMAAAEATLKFYRDSGCIDNSRIQGKYIIKRLNEMMDQYSCLGEVHGRGLLIGAYFVDENGKHGKESASTCARFIRECFKRGLQLWNTGPWGDAVKICPPLVITREQVDKGLQVFEEAVKVVDHR
ncbi:MAG: aspartate aminotransferase family protein [Candidatus Ranarchaeia archaeon]